MTRDELEHAIRAACDVAEETSVYVFGSQSILGEHPDAPAELRRSIEVDLSPVNRPDLTDRIDANLGELSQFHRTHGFYVHGIPIEEAASLPADWRDRLVLVQGPGTHERKGLCLEGHDLAASKLAAFRDKDKDFVRTLLREHMVVPLVLQSRLKTLNKISEEHRARITLWLEITSKDLGLT